MGKIALIQQWQRFMKIIMIFSGFRRRKTKPNKPNCQPLGVDIVVCRKEIWYKAFITRSTGIFRYLKRYLLSREVIHAE